MSKAVKTKTAAPARAMSVNAKAAILDAALKAFSRDGFDGASLPKIAEMAQIAGRAGRHLRDGSFGTTGRCPAFEPELAEKLESHSFESVKVLQWRNARLDLRNRWNGRDTRSSWRARTTSAVESRP